LHIGDEQELCTATLRIKSGSHLVLEGSGRIVVHKGSQLILEKGARFEQLDGRIDVEEGGELIILNGAEVELKQSSQWYLNGDQALIRCGTDLQLGLNADFDVFLNHSTSKLLFVESLTIEGESNSEIRWKSTGANGGEVVFEPEVLLSTHGTKRIYCSDIDMSCHEGLNLQSDAYFAAQACTVSGVEYAGSQLHFRNAGSVSNSWFENVELEFDQSLSSDPTHVALSNTKMAGDKAGLSLWGGKLGVNQCHFFFNAKIRTYNLDFRSTIRSSEFLGDGPDWPSTIFHLEDCAIADESEVDFLLKDCSIYNYRGAGIQKAFGKLFLQCNDFQSNHFGVNALLGVRVNMDLKSQNGGNFFGKNRIHVHLEGANAVALKDGRNYFGSSEGESIHGFLDGYCSCSTDLSINASGNEWAGTMWGDQPSPEELNVWLLANCDDQPWQEQCPVHVSADDVADYHCLITNSPPLAKSSSTSPQLLIQPNPASRELKVIGEQIEEVVLYSPLGKMEAIQVHRTNEGLRIELPNLADGMYFLHITTDEEQLVKRLIIDQ
jgi:hypothetical protein